MHRTQRNIGNGPNDSSCKANPQENSARRFFRRLWACGAQLWLWLDSWKSSSLDSWKSSSLDSWKSSSLDSWKSSSLDFQSKPCLPRDNQGGGAKQCREHERWQKDARDAQQGQIKKDERDKAHAKGEGE